MVHTVPQQLNRREALRYLGVKGEPDGATLALLDRAEQTLRRTAQPRSTVTLAPRAELSAYMLGSDLQKHLDGCDRCALLSCTLGAGVDTTQRLASATDMAYAVVLDALASVLAEQIADAAEDALRQQLQTEGLYVTGRFSPGYGDFPLEMQQALIRLTDAPRKIGLCVTPTHLLVPRKSITAVLGVADHPVTGKRAGCEHCALRHTCRYHKEGTTCESNL